MIKEFAVLISAVGTIIVLLVQLQLRLKLQRQELEFRKMEYEEKKAEREKHEKWLQGETVKLTKVGDMLGEKIFAFLKRDPEWAIEALEKAKLGPFAETIFGERSSHFREEKEFIADRFLPILLDRCKYQIEHERAHVYLLIDSGTTLFPFFKRLAVEAKRRTREAWLSHLTVVTNNLPGVESLMEFGRVDPHDRYSELAFDCRLLPGVPLPVYSAVAGPATEQAVRKLQTETHLDRESLFIGLLTGNWVRLRRSDPACPVPLVRGQSHLGFKQALLECCDEAYVISPLGKIFARASCEEVNRVLGFDGTSTDRAPYMDLQIKGEKASSVRLISTARCPGRVLSNLSVRIGERLNTREEDFSQFSSANFRDVPSLCFPFDKVPENWHLQIETEFPHVYTRDESIRRKWFFVPPDPANSMRANA